MDRLITMPNNSSVINGSTNLTGIVLKMTTSEKNAHVVCEHLRATLAHIVTKYDRVQAAKRYSNPNALAMYLGAVDECCEYLKLNPHVETRDGIGKFFEDRLRDVCLRGLGYSVR